MLILIFLFSYCQLFLYPSIFICSIFSLCTVPNSVCDDGSIRLVNGSSENEGVLEVCYLGTWGGVCLSQFGKTDASVICKQLGFFSNGKPHENYLSLHIAYSHVFYYYSMFVYI